MQARIVSHSLNTSGTGKHKPVCVGGSHLCQVCFTLVLDGFSGVSGGARARLLLLHNRRLGLNLELWYGHVVLQKKL